MQDTIGQRIKFLLDHFDLSARKFGREIGVAENNTQNYLPPSNREPGARYLELVLVRFESINPAWLLTGKGEPFLGEDPRPPLNIANKKNKGPIQNSTGSHATNTITTNVQLDNCQRDLEASRRESASYQREIELLKGQLSTKDALIASKEETIELLKTAFNRPH